MTDAMPNVVADAIDGIFDDAERTMRRITAAPDEAESELAKFEQRLLMRRLAVRFTAKHHPEHVTEWLDSAQP